MCMVATGVGHIFTAWLRFTLCIDPSCCWLDFSLSVKASAQVGVGQLPDGVLATNFTARLRATPLS